MNEYNMQKVYWKDRVEVKVYDDPIRVGKKRKGVKRRNFSQLSLKEQKHALERRKKYYRSRISYLKKLAVENDFCLFVTLTFEKNIEDPYEARTHWRLFIKRLRYRYPQVSFIGVPERQQRGAIHYHMILGGVNYIEHEELEKLWNHLGYVYIKKVRGGSEIVHYLFKYLTKEIDDYNKLEPWQKVYCSRNLKKPRVEKMMTEEGYDDLLFDYQEDILSTGSYFVTQETGIPINRCKVVTIAKKGFPRDSRGKKPLRSGVQKGNTDEKE